MQDTHTLAIIVIIVIIEMFVLIVILVMQFCFFTCNDNVEGSETSVGLVRRIGGMLFLCVLSAYMFVLFALFALSFFLRQGLVDRSIKAFRPNTP